MTLDEFITTIRGWTGYKDPNVHTNALITSWTRMGEERLNLDLRIADMVQIDTANILQNRVATPADWLENDFLREVDGNELVYLPRTRFYAEDSPRNFYTTSGKFLIIGGDIDQNEGKDVELHYFGQVPVLAGETNWVVDKHLRLLTSAVMTPASMYIHEAEAAALWETGVAGFIKTLNDQYLASKAKSGTMSRKIQSRFG